MDGELFDELTRSISSAATSRRRLLAGVALGSLLTATGASRVQATHFRCKDLGAPCRRGRSCCSGRCGGPNGSKTCSAHDPGICLTSQDTCAQGANGNLCGTTGATTGTTLCSCFITTGGASFCSGVSACTDCTKDRQCEISHGKGAACAVCADCPNPHHTACAQRCPNPD